MEIDLIDLLFFLRKKIWLIVAAFMVFALLGAGFTAFFAQDEYTAKTRMYVLNRTQEAPAVSSDYNVSNYMIEDYKVLITGENVTREVLSKLKLNMSISELSGKISVSSISGTRVLQIVVVDTDPHRAAAIANCVQEISSAQIESIMDVDAVNLVYAATVPTHKSGPNLLENTVVAAVIGFVLAVFVLMIIHLMDDTIRTDEDVTRYLGLGTLGVIPNAMELNHSALSGALQKKAKTGGRSKSSRKF
jgi:capsular polysaccharide biosynthesis protein